jgi:ESX secretion system protein EccE
MSQPGHDGTVYRAQPVDATPQPAAEPAGQGVPAPAQAPVPAIESAPDVWSARATTTRGMIGRPASRAAVEAAGSAQATEAGLATTAIPDVTTRAAEIVPDPPRIGTVYGRPHADRTGKVLSGRMARLHIGWHTASIGAVGMVGVSTTGTGLLVGTDRRQRGVPVRFFRPEPTRIALVGGDWAAAILVYRALALGATVSVWTDDPHRWRDFADRTTGGSGRIAVNPAHATHPPATAQQPLLFVTDDAAVGSADPSELGPWRTEFTVLRRLDERGVPVLQDSDLVIAQRLGSGESAIAASALRIPGPVLAPLQQVDDETVALLDPSGHHYLRISPTDIERGYAGSARR